MYANASDPIIFFEASNCTRLVQARKGALTKSPETKEKQRIKAWKSLFLAYLHHSFIGQAKIRGKNIHF